MLANPETWVGVALIIFLALALWKGLKPAMAALDARTSKIADELAEAQRLREEAQAYLAETNRKLEAAKDEAQRIVQTAKEEAERLARQGSADLKDHLARREQQALDKIAQAESSALAEVRGKAVDLAVAAAGRIMAEKVTGARATGLIDDAIKDLGGKLN